MPACKDCKHCKVSIIDQLVFMPKNLSHMCVRPSLGADELTGKQKKAFCYIERQYEFCCGQEGKHFERK